ncbi:MAG TPA: PAS domain S-box protein [Chloroflexota bacterium]
MVRYGLALAACLVALVPWTVWGTNFEPSPFPLFMLAILVSAWFGGLGPGLAAAVLAALLTLYVYLPPKYSLAIDSLQSAVQLAVFGVIALLVTWLTVRRQGDEHAHAQLASIVESSDNPIIGKTLNGTVTSWNPAAERLYGFKAAEILGRPITTIIPPEEQEGFRMIMDRVQRGLSTDQYETTRVARDGRLVPVSVTVSPIRDRHGNIVGASSIARDITDIKRAEQERTQLLEAEKAARAAAQIAEQRFAFLAEASNVLSSSLDYEVTLASVARLAVPRVSDWCAVHIVDDDGAVRQLAVEHIDPTKVALASELVRLYPYDPDAANGVPAVLRSGEPEFISDIPDELIEQVIEDEELLRIVRELGLTSSMTVPLKARDQILGAIQFVAAESRRHFDESDLLLAQDLADRAALAIDNARLYRRSEQVAAERSAILNTMADGVLIADPSGRIVYANPAASTILGMQATSFAGTELSALVAQFQPQDAEADAGTAEESALGFALRGERVPNIERETIRPDGIKISIQASASPLVTEDGRFAGGVTIFRDVTAERSLERQKESFLSAAAHDLKNPLASIKTLAQMLERRALRSQDAEMIKMADGLGRIDATTTHMAALVNELLDVTRLQMGRPVELERRPTDLVALIGRVAGEQQAASERHRIVVDASVPELIGQWDPARLERVIVNLLSNAVKYSPGGGKIHVKIDLARGTGPCAAIVSVTDSGLGIPTVDLPHVFDRFHRGANVASTITGTGLGLSGAKYIVEEHGGSIEVESTEGEGATFTVILPLESTRGEFESADAADTS